MCPGFKTYYLGILGYHVFMLVYHTLVDEIRHDYMTMLYHHTLTLVLFISVYMLNFLRISLAVLVINDVPDIFI